MKIVIDSNSLLSLVRYYMPFDEKGILYHFIKDKIEKGEIIIIDKVLEECSYISKGFVLTSLDFLKEKTFLKSAKLPIKTDTILAPAPKKFLRQLDSQFVNSVIKRSRKLTETEFESQKSSFLNSADMRQIILCLNLIKEGQMVVLVTEETESSNDNKLFKKIPAICTLLEIETKTLPELIAQLDGINIDFS